jgi:hypothetical protein
MNFRVTNRKYATRIYNSKGSNNPPIITTTTTLGKGRKTKGK